ncbi:MAG: pyruvate kinase [Fimbriimonadaceae bacterium]|nr:MAG: pyruvate kinase [Fimbriimonadaceae bacterium]
MRHTKIVCTLGPAVESQEMIASLIKEGMNLARLNCSHGDWESKRKFIEWIRAESPDLSPVGIMADLQGPKTRLAKLEGDVRTFATGEKITIGLANVDLPVASPELVHSMKKGDRILLGDGQCELKLTSGEGDTFEAKITAGGTVKSKQGVTIVGRSFDIPALTTKDLGDITQAIAAGCDYIALSYVRTSADMRELRQIVDRIDPSVKLVAKIETKEALKEIDAIIKLSDVIMVARGDLGLQMEIEDVPAAQKRIIHKCNSQAVPVITATQMLESMVSASRPTRAEASDVANAILDGTDAVMLSGETASGEYPIESVRIMAKIAMVTEDHVKAKFKDDFSSHTTDVVAESAVNIARGIKAKAILTTSASGMTPRMVSKYRPVQPILCACWSDRVQRQLSVSRGVQSLLVDAPLNTDDAIRSTVNAFLRRKLFKVGDQVVITAGVPVGQPGNTNLIQVVNV